MESATSQLLQSRYFSSVFNTAIFDGPVRVYFSQHQEQEALKLYFRIQKKIQASEKLQAMESGPTIFVMLYPNGDSFDETFSTGDETVVESLGDDFVIGVKGPFRDELSPVIEAQIDNIDFK